MKIEENVILIKGEDKTKSIKYCKYIDGKYKVTFDNEKSYDYNYNSVKWFRNPKEINIEGKIIYDNEDIPLSNVKMVLEFEGYIRIIFKTGFSKLYKKREIKIEESALNERRFLDVFTYFKRLSENIGLSVDGDKKLLGKNYAKVNNISPATTLAIYLNPKKVLKKYKVDNYIFPFGFNASQKKATENALTNQISIIEGPPGTGKTQTILNIICNAILNNKTVAIVSNNNSATANVLEKLERQGLGWIAAFLGNNKNKEAFIESQDSMYPNLEKWQLEKEEISAINKDLLNRQEQLNSMLEKKNKLANIKTIYSEFKVEKNHFYKEYITNEDSKGNFKTLFKLNSDEIMRLIIEYQLMIEKKEELSFISKLSVFLRYGIYNFDFYKKQPSETINLLFQQFYEIKEAELEIESSTLEKLLNSYNFNGEMNHFSEQSMKLLKAKLANKYIKNKERRRFESDDLWKNFNKFIKEYPIILSTTHSLKSSIADNFMFDYLIIDEASQVDVVTGALALSCAKNAVIVGDLKQLSNVVAPKERSISIDIFNSFQINEAYAFHNNSLLESITKLKQDLPRVILKEHYRCHPKIIGFCNKEFYNNELIIMTNEKESDTPLKVYKSSKGNHARGKINQRQIDIINEEVIPSLGGEKSIGIISPYRKQADEITKNNQNMVEADTVHKYQGREKKAIILTTVSNETNDFIDNENLINVAVSRAIDKFILIVPDNDYSKENSNIADLIKYVQYNNYEVVNSKVNSIFDFLYSSYSDKLKEVLKNCKKVSKYDSENLMYMLIEKVLAEKEFNNLKVVLHVPLKMIIRDCGLLENEEKNFVKNPLTHIDFVIFNTIDKSIVLAVEVDGYKYHANNPKQLKRDKMKDNILEKYKIPTLRFATNESEEEKRLREKMNRIYSSTKK